MLIDPTGPPTPSVHASPARRPALPAADVPPDRDARFVLEGASGLVVQSYGAIAVISTAALAQLAAARRHPATFEVPAVLPISPVARIPRIDVLV